jgi:uncharacterized membrane protein
MNLTVDDIDDISVSGSRVILAIGARRFFFDNLSHGFTERLEGLHRQGRLADSREISALLGKIDVDRTAKAGPRPGKTILCLPSYTVKRLARPFLRLMIAPISLAICAAAALCGAYAMRDGFTAPLAGARQMVQAYDFAVAFFVYILSVFVHEFGHAAACLKKTGLVGSIKVRLRRGLPVFTTDVSSVHFASPRDQAQIAIAGVVFQLCFAAFLLLSPVLGMRMGAIFALVAALFCLIPYPGSDGFWFINDAFRLDLPKTFREASVTRKATHGYAIFLVIVNLAVCYLLLRFGFDALGDLMARGHVALSTGALWVVFIAYSILVVSSQAIKTGRFLRDGAVSR